MVVREAIGALKVAAVECSKPIYPYTPQHVKKQITGNGAAKKIDVAIEISNILNLQKFDVEVFKRGNLVMLSLTPEELVKKKLEHISDALSIGYCRLLEVRKEERGLCNV